MTVLSFNLILVKGKNPLFNPFILQFVLKVQSHQNPQLHPTKAKDNYN